LIGVALERGQVAEASGYARALLASTQQRLPDRLTAAVEKAVAAWEDGAPGGARASLVQGIALAQELGYL
jgi:hypothetical protein